MIVAPVFALALSMSAQCDPCGLLPPLPAPVDVGLSAAGGGVGAELTVISLVELGSFIGAFGGVNTEPWGIPVVLGGLFLAWPVGAVVAASERADLRGGSPLWVGVATGVPATIASGVATAFFYSSLVAADDASRSNDVLIGLGVLLGGAVVQGVAAGVVTGFTGGSE